MLSKRHSTILKLLDMQGTMSIAALARALDVSPETVRRDLQPLTESGRLVRMHGAVGLAGQIGEAPFQRRMRENAGAKLAIAATVAAGIRDGEAVMLDTGTTTSFVARALLRHRRLTIVTNSTDIALTLAAVSGNRVYLAGGELRSDSGAAFGPTVQDFVARFSVAHTIISAGAVDADGVMDFDLEEAALARLMLSRGARCVVVTDHDKFTRRGLVRVAAFAEIDELVTDRDPPAAIATALGVAGVALTVALARRRAGK